MDRSHPEVPSYSIFFIGRGGARFFVERETEIGDLIVEDSKREDMETDSGLYKSFNV